MGLPLLATNWSQIPMVFVTILFILGIQIDNWINVHKIFTLQITLLFLLILLVSPKKIITYHARGFLIAILLILSGLLHSSYNRTNQRIVTKYYNYSVKPSIYSAEITSLSESKKYDNLTVIFFALIDDQGSHFQLPPSKGLIKLKKQNVSNYFKVGDHISASISLSSTSQDLKAPENKYHMLLSNQGISHIAYGQYNQIEKEESKYSILKSIRYGVRNEALERLEKYIIDQHALSIMKALLLGYKNDIDRATIESFKNSGTMHILAVSGLHVGIVAFMIFQIVGKLLFFLPRYSAIKTFIIILGLIFFAEISGGAPPVWRAVLVTSLYFLGRSYSFQSNSLNLLGSAAFCILILNPNSLFSLSFQLSFVAVLGIILLYPVLESIYPPKGKVQNYVIGIVYMGVAAQVAITPVALYYFNQISILSPFTSVIAISSAFILIYLGILVFTTAWIHPSIASFYSLLSEKISSLMIETSHYMSTVKFGLIKHTYLSSIEAWIIGLALLIISRAIYKQSLKLTRHFLLMIAIQGFLHSFYSIQHVDCFEVIRAKDSQEIIEIYIGREAFTINTNNQYLYQINESRRLHRIQRIFDISHLQFR